MTQPARLITPSGKTIDLSDEVYAQIKKLLRPRARRKTQASMAKAIQETYGKYAGTPSLTQDLLEEHAREQARERARIAKLRG